MNLSPDLQQVLLELANADRAQAHPTRQSPEEKELADLLAQRERLASAAAAAQMAVDDLELDILRIQEDERKLKKRDLDDKRQLTAETDPERRKDLEHDRYAAKSRLADLYYELKEAHGEVKALRNNRDIHGARLDEIDRKVELARRAVDAAPGPVLVDRDALRAKLPADVLSLYDDIGAAAFNGRTCNSCFITVPQAERSHILSADADELPTCPNCGALLVRVAPGE
ncbi:zinc ribbon domain-containing protein [Corynebacterium qintianiae]|uniref:zinc ribbon domain-containing protein n=1 Tax=Corynebacterium qintianiae TaxID=2709392 RepID=UPI0013EDCF88|nr:C4-type zinc ribbon domain-containing protein [Corynebacterium qintianiae]